jgi:hypothetical protein
MWRSLTIHNKWKKQIRFNLLFFLIVTTLLLLGGSSSTLALDATRAASTVGRCQGKVNVFLGIETDDERWNVDDLLSDAI